jgi:hypothetical protein
MGVIASDDFQALQSGLIGHPHSKAGHCRTTGQAPAGGLGGPVGIPTPLNRHLELIPTRFRVSLERV